MKSIKTAVFYPIALCANLCSIMLFLMLHWRMEKNISHWNDSFCASSFWARKVRSTYLRLSRFLQRFDLDSRRLMHLSLYNLIELILERPDATEYTGLIEGILQVFPNTKKRHLYLDAQRLTYRYFFEQSNAQYRSLLDRMGYESFSHLPSFSTIIGGTSIDPLGLRHQLWDPGFEPLFCKALSQGHLSLAKLFAQYQLPWSYQNPKTGHFFLPNAFLYLFGPLSFRLSGTSQEQEPLKELFMQAVFQPSTDTNSNPLTGDQIIDSPIHLSAFSLPIVRSANAFFSNDQTISLRTLFQAYNHNAFLEHHVKQYDALREQTLLDSQLLPSQVQHDDHQKAQKVKRL